MKPTHALALSLAAGLATLGIQTRFFPAKLHAATFQVPSSADWRQQMIDRDPGGAIVDHALRHLSAKLDLSAAQASKLRPILEKQHERILAVLLTAPSSMTRDQFIADRERIESATRAQMDTLLSPDQVELARELHRPSNG